MRFRRKLTLERGSLDITPLIDVVFLLLVFFMLTSSFLMQPSIRVNLPRVHVGAPVEVQKLEITIDGGDNIYLGKRQVTIEELKAVVTDWVSQSSSLPVLIRGDEDASLGRVVQVWDICKAAGITKLRIGTEVRYDL
jgi:biopolymer transport protein ExbD